MTEILGIIPARFASTRFPGKPLIDIAGKTMIQRVYEQCKKSKFLSNTIVATDDARIYNHVLQFGGQVVMTASHHQSGTDRCQEVAQLQRHYEVFINIQGDEPFIDPSQIDLLCTCFEHPTHQLATLIKEIRTLEELNNPNTPKVVINSKQEALYFSRTAVPYFKGKPINDWIKEHRYYKHIGIYGYRKQALFDITHLPISSLEKAESLEQLRWLENGYRIQTAVTAADSQAIDTPDDYHKIIKMLNNGTLNI